MQLPATVFYVVRGKKIIILVPTKWGCLLPREIFSASMRQNFCNLCPLLMRRCFSYGRIGGLALGATLLCSKCGARASSLALYILNFQCVKSSLHQTSVCVCVQCVVVDTDFETSYGCYVLWIVSSGLFSTLLTKGASGVFWQIQPVWSRVLLFYDNAK